MCPLPPSGGGARRPAGDTPHDRRPTNDEPPLDPGRADDGAVAAEGDLAKGPQSPSSRPPAPRPDAPVHGLDEVDSLHDPLKGVPRPGDDWDPERDRRAMARRNRTGAALFALVAVVVLIWMIAWA